MGTVEERTVYLTGAPAWIGHQDPGAVREHTDGTATTVKQKDAKVIYITHKGIFNSRTNVRQEVIDT